jgi:hypothetical protein
LEAKFGSARAGDGDTPYISRQGQRSEAGRPYPPWRCTLTVGGVASVGERATFSSPDENARAGETAPKLQCQPTLATPLVMPRILFKFNIILVNIVFPA